MRININKNRGLDLVGDILNDENKDYWVLLKVQPTGLESPSSEMDEATQKVAVSDGLARVVDSETVDKFLYEPRIENA